MATLRISAEKRARPAHLNDRTLRDLHPDDYTGSHRNIGAWEQLRIERKSVEKRSAGLRDTLEGKQFNQPPRKDIDDE